MSQKGLMWAIWPVRTTTIFFSVAILFSCHGGAVPPPSLGQLDGGPSYPSGGRPKDVEGEVAADGPGDGFIPQVCTTHEECDDENPCTLDTCNETMGVCEHSCLVGETCDDGHRCSTGDSCQVLEDTCTCLGTMPEPDQTGQCITFHFDESTCSYAYQCNSDIPCDDGDQMTIEDRCKQDGECLCSGLRVECTADEHCDDKNPCTDAKCLDNKCYFACQKGAGCDDGKPTTTNDLCREVAGKCACQGEPVVCTTDGDCDDMNPCTTDKCTGNKCDHSCRANAPCDLPLGQSGICREALGVCGCVPETSYECIIDSQCDDNNPCSYDRCWAFKCEHQCLVGSTCDDKDPKTVQDVCVTGPCRCQGMMPECLSNTDCDDGSECTLDSCWNYTCVHACRTGQSCSGGVCALLSGQCTCSKDTQCLVNSDCLDLNPCTFDQCISGVCVYTCSVGMQCFSGTGSGVCVLEDGKCICYKTPTMCLKDADCEDFNECTEDKCTAGMCENSCRDGAPCYTGGSPGPPGRCFSVGMMGCTCRGGFS